ncbi:hypothetical protein E2320_006643, partial [Naja naja]
MANQKEKRIHLKLRFLPFWNRSIIPETALSIWKCLENGFGSCFAAFSTLTISGIAIKEEQDEINLTVKLLIISANKMKSATCTNTEASQRKDSLGILRSAFKEPLFCIDTSVGAKRDGGREGGREREREKENMNKLE